MKRRSPLGSIGAVMCIMLVGKLLSLVANQAYLSYFGAGNEQLNIFSWVLQIPNYLFQSFGTGLSSVVIPIFASLCVTGQREEANRFASNLICVASLFTLVLVACGMALSGVLPRFTEFVDKDYASMALRIMMPVMLFYALTNIYQGILQSLEHFAVPALVNLPSGIVLLLYLACFADRFGVTGLLYAVVLGLFLQAAILIVPGWKAGFRFRPVVDLRSGHLRTAGRMMVPVVLGASAYQFNMLFNNTMMSNVAPNSVSLFNFVQTLILSSVLTLVTAITSVMYPALTARAAENDMPGFRKTLSGTVNAMIFLLTPITVGLLVLGHPLLELISLHGKMLPEDIRTVDLFLMMYCVSVVFLGIKEIMDRAFYSLKITGISAITGVIIMVVNLIVGYVLSKFTPLGAAGIPLGYSIAAICGTVFLTGKLYRRIGGFGGGILGCAGKTAVSSLLMGAGVYGVYRLISRGLTSGSIGDRLLLVLIPTLFGMAAYFALSWVLKTAPMVDFLASVRRKGR